MTRLKVAHVITDLGTGGAEIMLLRLLQQMDRARYDAQVISLKQTHPVGDRIAALGIPVRALGIGAMPAPWHFARLAAWLRRDRVDVVQTWMIHADLIGGLAARLAGDVPVAWGIHAGKLDRATHGRVALWTTRVNARLSHWLPRRIICCSETSRSELTALHYDAERLQVIQNGFDLDVFKPDPEARASVRRELGLPDDALLVGQVGRFHPQKDHLTFLRAARQVDAHVLLCGRDVTRDNPQLREWVGDLSSRVHILGPRDDVPRLTAAMDVACSSSSFGEAFPLVIGEAMASGVPCAVTDCGDSALMVGDTGRVVPIRDPAALASAIGSLLALGADGRRALGERARRRIRERFDLADVVGRYHQAYDELSGRNG